MINTDDVNYDQLAETIMSYLNTARQQPKRLLGRCLLEAYWEIGKLISKAGIIVEYGGSSSSLKNLIKKVDIPEQGVYSSIQLYRYYPKGCPEDILTWSHYRILLTIKNSKEREWYRDLANTKQLSRNKLITMIKEKAFHSNLSIEHLERPKDPLYVYKAFVDDVIDGETLLIRIDLGFTITIQKQLKLAKVKVPKLGTPGAIEAKKFIKSAIKNCDFIVVFVSFIKNVPEFKIDVFYWHNEKDPIKVFRQGQYLNEQLLVSGNATAI